MAETVVYLGNRAAVEVLPDPDDDITDAIAEERPLRTLRRPIARAPRKNCTTVRIPDGMPLMEGIGEVIRTWGRHSNDPAPAWVASTNPSVSALLGEHWQAEIREPEPDHEASGADDLVEG